MKIAAISDLHGNLQGLDFGGYDVVVIAGDIAPTKGFGKWHKYEQTKWINKKFKNFTDSFSKTQFVIIPGNHDFFPIAKETVNDSSINWNFSFGDNVHFLLDSSCEINGIKFYGTPWIPIISYSWAFESEHDFLVEKFDKIPNNIDILITHSPPRISGCNVDYSIQTRCGPFGSSELANAIFNKKPKYVFCGHIHSGDHIPFDFEGSKIINVSRLDERYEIWYNVFEMEI